MMEDRYVGLVVSNGEIIAAGLFIVGCVMIATGLTRLSDMAVDGIINKIEKKKWKRAEA